MSQKNRCQHFVTGTLKNPIHANRFAAIFDDEMQHASSGNLSVNTPYALPHTPLPPACCLFPISNTANLDGEGPLLSDVLADSSETPPFTSRMG